MFRVQKEMATTNQLDDITECSICTEEYTDPRVLPCGHTFCLKCIETWSKNKHPGDNLACPLCRKEFTLPSNGVGDLPKNFFVVNFLQIKGLAVCFILATISMSHHNERFVDIKQENCWTIELLGSKEISSTGMFQMKVDE